MALARILLALDPSEASRVAAAFAARLAASSGAQLFVAHAVAAAADVMDESRLEEELALLRRHAHDEADAIGKKPPPAIDLVRMGHPARAVVTLAAERGADLIVTGTRDRARPRLRDGSVAGEVVRTAHASVLVVSERATPPPPGAPAFERPLVALAGDDAGALRAAAALCGDVAIDVLHVIAREPDRGLEDAGERARCLRAAREQLDARARAALAGTRARLHPRVIFGRMPEAAADFAAGSAPDLVSCGIRAPALSGNTAEALLDAVTCPVLIHRAPAPRETPTAPPRPRGSRS